MPENLINHFEKTKTQDIGIELAAETACVSTSTIRNWIKTGYLLQSESGGVTEESFKYLLDNIVGVEKLTSRANKSHKGFRPHNHRNLYSANFAKTLHGESLGIAYEQSLSNSHRNKEGIYYTPLNIVKDMFKDVPIDKSSTFLDPCCGSGNFILEAIKRGVLPQNIYGFDIDPNAVEITKKRILEETGIEVINIKVGDFLTEASKLNKEGVVFDLIITNPPWGKKLTKPEKQQFAQLYGSGKSIDTTALFLFASLPLLKEGGHLGFLVQEAFFNISSYEDARKKIISYDLRRLIDYRKPFDGLITKAFGISLRNTKIQNSSVECGCIKNPHVRSKISFIKTPKFIFNIWASEEESLIINHIYSLPHTDLKGKAKWALGIVTGNNSKYCISNPQENYLPIFKGADITKNGIKNPSNYILDAFDKFQQVAPIENYHAEKKIIYKFISSDLVFFYDDCQRLVLNSANIVIPSESLGVSFQHLVKLFNSDIINWIFLKLFNTHKVLRGDLESLPIHLEYLSAESTFSEQSYLSYLGLEKIDNKTYKKIKL